MDNCENKPSIDDVDKYSNSTLRLIFNESKYLREKDYENIDKNIDLVWKQITLLTFLAGVFFSLARFIYEIKLENGLALFLLAYSYVFAAFLFSIYEIYPKQRYLGISPDALYKECGEKERMLLYKFIQTYLINSKKVKASSKNTIFIRKCITILTAGFVLQISLIICNYLLDIFVLDLILSGVLFGLICMFLLFEFNNRKVKEE